MHDVWRASLFLGLARRSGQLMGPLFSESSKDHASLGALLYTNFLASCRLGSLGTCRGRGSPVVLPASASQHVSVFIAEPATCIFQAVFSFYRSLRLTYSFFSNLPLIFHFIFGGVPTPLFRGVCFYRRLLSIPFRCPTRPLQSFYCLSRFVARPGRVSSLFLPKCPEYDSDSLNFCVLLFLPLVCGVLFFFSFLVC